MNLDTILLSHARTHPRMEPRDAVKLLYQNEFGGGHLIRDPKAALEFLQQEYGSLEQSASLPLTEDIGNGMVRVHLAALEHHGLSLTDFGDIFLRSAACPQGTLDSFRKKLSLLVSLTTAGSMPFSQEMLAHYLQDYQQAGFPIVSHSETYRKSYHPAYRVVRSDILSHFFKQMP